MAVTSLSGSVSGAVPLRCPLCAESPFTRSRRYLLRRGVLHHVRERYLSFVAHTGSCVRPNASHRLQLSLFRWVFAGCRQPLLTDGPSRRYLCNLCIGAWTLTPRCFFGAFTRFFPKNIGLTLGLRRFGTSGLPLQSNFNKARIFGLQSFPLCSGSHTR